MNQIDFTFRETNVNVTQVCVHRISPDERSREREG